jgi:TolB-like protein
VQPIASALMRTSHAPRCSVAVLPFVNLNGDPEQDHFVDGITESLTTDASRTQGAFVIARNTALTYKGKAVDARQIGRELGVRYVMEGSVQSDGDCVRVNAQLIDTETGAHLWAERFDKPRANLFTMQDEIAARLARTLDVEVVAAEARRAERERPNHMDAVDLALRGWAIWNQRPSSGRAREARGFFAAALRLDRQNINGLLGFAATHLYEASTFASDNPADQIRLAEAATSLALTLAPDNANAHMIHGNVLHLSRAPDRALSEFDLAIALNPSLAWAHAWAGFTKISLGRAEETEADVENAIRLSPRSVGLDAWQFFIGVADLHLSRLDQAIDRIRKSIEINPAHPTGHFFLAAALALTSREREAVEARATGRRLSPKFTMSRFRAEARSDNPVYLAQRKPIYEGLRKAGMPEE